MRTPISQRIKKWFSVDTESIDDEAQALDSLVEHWKDEGLLDALEQFEAIDLETAWQSINDKPNSSSGKTTTKVISIRSILRYAAIFLVPLATAFYLFTTFYNSQKVETLDQTIVLNIDNQNSVLLGQKENTIYDEDNHAIAKGSANNLTYLPQNFKSGHQSKEHSLKIPHGKTFKVTLSDGTRVYCDAGTTLTYPTHFQADKIRKVQLEGQAFFDVAKSKSNAFVVQTNTIDIRVLGTQFNVNAYAQNKAVKTVLVEGSVLVLSKVTEDSVLLVPNQQVMADPTSGKLKVSEVVAYDHFAWVTGKLVFNKVPFNVILENLERKFGVKIINTNTHLGKQVFTAKFENESINQVMTAFKSEADFDYEVANNIIIIK